MTLKTITPEIVTADAADIFGPIDGENPLVLSEYTGPRMDELLCILGDWYGSNDEWDVSTLGSCTPTDLDLECAAALDDAIDTLGLIESGLIVLDGGSHLATW